MTERAGAVLRLSPHELGTVARFLGDEGRLAVQPLEAGSLAARVALDALRARGLVHDDDDHGFVPGDELQEFLAVAKAADQALVVTVFGESPDTAVSWLIGPTAALEQQWVIPGVYELQVMEPGLAAERVHGLLSGVASDGEAEAQELRAAPEMVALALGEPGNAVDDLPPLLTELAAAIARGSRQCSIDLRRQSGPEVGGVRLTWLDAGEAGLWEIDADGAEIVVRRLDPADIASAVAQITAGIA